MGHLGRNDEAITVYKNLDDAYPNFSIADYRRETAIWNLPDEWTELTADGLRASGVPEGIPTN